MGQKANINSLHLTRNIDWNSVTEQAHKDIWDFHLELEDQDIKHIFFNGNNHFGNIANDQRYSWGASYIGPYDPGLTYNQWLKNNGFDTVSPDSWHFGSDAHAAWGRYVLKYVISNHLV